MATAWQAVVQQRANAELELRRRRGKYKGRKVRFREFGERYEHDYAGFMRDCIDWKGEEPSSYQLEIAQGVVDNARESARGPHGLGKSTTAACVVLAFTLTQEALGHNWKALTTASSWTQLTAYLWPEIHKWVQRLKWDKIGCKPWRDGKELLKRNIQLNYGRASAVASSDHSKIEGGHEDYILFIFDEAKAIQTETWDALEGAFSTAGPDTGKVAYALAVSTPGDSAGRFYDIQTQKPGYGIWHARHVTVEEAIAAKRVSLQWVEQRKEAWGEDSALYQRRVLGNFAQDAANAIIPIEWLESAQERWRDWDAGGRLREDGTPMRLTSIGVDVGGGKETGDATTIALVYDYIHVGDLIRITKAQNPEQALMELAGRVRQLMEANRPEHVYIDVIGIGAGVVQRLREMGYDARAFHAAAKTDLLDSSQELGFVNWRACGWWTLREYLAPHGKIRTMIPPDEQLVGELAAAQQKGYTSTSQIMVESKDDIRKRLQGHSTDGADAVIHALIGPALFADAMRHI